MLLTLLMPVTFFNLSEEKAQLISGKNASAIFTKKYHKEALKVFL